jgi:hypothetical protein
MGTFHIPEPKELSYVHVPRTGMAMKKIIAEWLKVNFTVKEHVPWMINHPNFKTVREMIPSGKTMTVVRNPWQRVYSFYRKVNTEGYWLDWNGMTLLDLKPINEWVFDYCNPDVPFEFPRWFNRFTNQVDFISYDDIWVDYILRAEDLEQDFKQVQEYLECNIPLPDLSGYDHHEYRMHFNSDSIKAISKVFEKDVDFFKFIP